MNPFIYQVFCCICGGPAMATPSYGISYTYSHRDPKACAYYLAEKEIKRNQAVKSLEEENEVLRNQLLATVNNEIRNDPR